MRTATGANSLDVRCLATGAKTSLVSMDNMVVSFSILLSLHVNVGQSVHSPSLFLFIHLLSYKLDCFCVWWPGADEAFHLFLAPATHFVVAAVVVMPMSHKERPARMRQ